MKWDINITTDELPNNNIVNNLPSVPFRNVGLCLHTSCRDPANPIDCALERGLLSTNSNTLQ